MRGWLERSGPTVFTAVAGAGRLLHLFFHVRLSQAVHRGDVRARTRLALPLGLQDRAGAGPGGRLRALQVHRDQGGLGDRASPAGRGDHRAGRPVLAGPGGLRPDPAALEHRRPVRQRPAARHDLGPGLRLHGRAAGVRGPGVDPVRQLHPLLRRGEVDRRLADRGLACRSVLDAGGHGRAVHAAAGAVDLGAEPASRRPARATRPNACGARR